MNLCVCVTIVWESLWSLFQSWKYLPRFHELPSCLYSCVFSVSGFNFPIECICLTCIFPDVKLSPIITHIPLLMDASCFRKNALEKKYGGAHEGGICEVEKNSFTVNLRHSDFKMFLTTFNKFFLVSYSN